MRTFCLADCCLNCMKHCHFCIISVDGGDKDNAIPVDSKAEIVVSDEDIDEIQSLAAAFQEKCAVNSMCVIR